jgi:hypothetical protein
MLANEAPTNRGSRVVAERNFLDLKVYLNKFAFRKKGRKGSEKRKGCIEYRDVWASAKA